MVQKQFERIIPLRAISSMCGVLLIREPYAPIACAAWSSVMIYRMLSRFALAAASRFPPRRDENAAAAARPGIKSRLDVFMRSIIPKLDYKRKSSSFLSSGIVSRG